MDDVTDWSDVEFFAPRLRPRKTNDFLSILANTVLIWDILSCAMTGAAALFVYVRYSMQGLVDPQTLQPFQRDIIFSAVIAALILRNSSKELDPHSHSTWHIVMLAERNCLISFSILISIGLVTRTTNDLAHKWLILWMMMFASAVGLSRYLLGQYLHWLLARGELREAVAIIGAAGSRERVASRISAEADVIGMFTAIDVAIDTVIDEDADEEQDDGLKHLFELGRAGNLDAVILSFDSQSHPGLQSVIDKLKQLPLQVALCPNSDWAGCTAPRMRMLGGMPMTVVADRPIKHWDLFVKTVFDKLGAVFLLLILSPLMACIALAIAATSSGPVIFRQLRRGWCGKEFVILKFRTMHCGHTVKIQTRRNDPRCTLVGRFLRSTSLDELPQLWNVISGDMSLVGPRPHAESLHDLDQAEHDIVAEYAQRHRVKPGLTGWAQVNGARGATESQLQLRRRIELDLYYIDNWSIMLDLRILLRTPLVMVGERAF